MICYALSDCHGFFSHRAGSNSHLTKSNVLPLVRIPTNNRLVSGILLLFLGQLINTESRITSCQSAEASGESHEYRLMSGHQHKPPFCTRLRVKTDLWLIFKGILKQSQLQQASTKEQNRAAWSYLYNSVVIHPSTPEIWLQWVHNHQKTSECSPCCIPFVA